LVILLAASFAIWRSGLVPSAMSSHATPCKKWTSLVAGSFGPLLPSNYKA